MSQLSAANENAPGRRLHRLALRAMAGLAVFMLAGSALKPADAVVMPNLNRGPSPIQTLADDALSLAQSINDGVYRLSEGADKFLQKMKDSAPAPAPTPAPSPSAGCPTPAPMKHVIHRLHHKHPKVTTQVAAAVQPAAPVAQPPAAPVPQASQPAPADSQPAAPVPDYQPAAYAPQPVAVVVPPPVFVEPGPVFYGAPGWRGPSERFIGGFHNDGYRHRIVQVVQHVAPAPRFNGGGPHMNGGGGMRFGGGHR